MKAACVIVRSMAPSTAGSGFSDRLQRHVATCLPCQAELARYSKLRRRLAAMAEVVEPAPQYVARDVAASISQIGEIPAGRSRSRHLARVAAATGALAAATAGVVAVWRQSKGVA
jgi:hypothetical protein